MIRNYADRDIDYLIRNTEPDNFILLIIGKLMFGESH